MDHHRHLAVVRGNSSSHSRNSLQMNTIIDKLQEHLQPDQVANALYETMLDWKIASDRIRKLESGSKEWMRQLGKLTAYEKCLCKFFGVSMLQMQALLEQHFRSGESSESGDEPAG